MSHIMIMTLSNTAGITALFMVKMFDLFLLSLLGEKHLAAAVGYASTLCTGQNLKQYQEIDRIIL